MDYDIITAHGLISAPYRILKGSGFKDSAPYQILDGNKFMDSAPYWILEGSGFIDSIYG